MYSTLLANVTVNPACTLVHRGSRAVTNASTSRGVTNPAICKLKAARRLSASSISAGVSTEPEGSVRLEVSRGASRAPLMMEPSTRTKTLKRMGVVASPPEEDSR